MNKEQLNNFKSRLNSELDLLKHHLTIQANEKNDLHQHEVGDFHNHSEDSAEDVLEKLTASEINLISKIELALSKIDNGSYGICTGCGNKIPVSRLDAKPSVSLCFDCQQEHEQVA